MLDVELSTRNVNGKAVTALPPRRTPAGTWTWCRLRNL
jgi:hypothetical protein